MAVWRQLGDVVAAGYRRYFWNAVEVLCVEHGSSQFFWRSSFDSSLPILALFLVFSLMHGRSSSVTVVRANRPEHLKQCLRITLDSGDTQVKVVAPEDSLSPGRTHSVGFCV